MEQTHLSTTDIARWFDVMPRTVVKWRDRYPDFPKPDVVIGQKPGWLPEREAEIRAWHAARPAAEGRTFSL